MTKSDLLYSSQSQIFWTFKALRDGRTLSTRAEIRDVKGWRLSAVTERLRKQYVGSILTEYRGPQNIAHYRLAPGTDLSKLRLPPSAKSLADDCNGGAA
ncbi:hypothetical protein [Salipiger marinus]|uniref:Uncharacterized protein n=1 Tax=Salipiger marinus TaxID=555512 RepID=A0A1G8N0C3_9RHOB|nr:hypothetical protein [Salipiger marinus]SDI73527.1 hypothetical protein SAMN04487993_100970 [Salipiger marinus]